VSGEFSRGGLKANSNDPDEVPSWELLAVNTSSDADGVRSDCKGDEQRDRTLGRGIATFLEAKKKGITRMHGSKRRRIHTKIGRRRGSCAALSFFFRHGSMSGVCNLHDCSYK
jgi:hypothetical protein